MNKHESVLKTAGILMATLLLETFSSVQTAHAQDLRRIISLAGAWKFEIGDNPRYSERDYDDSKWEELRVPGTWENQGFPGYDGYAWYRRRFRTPAEAGEFLLYLQLGAIDDVDEAYVNGKMIGYQGRMPPAYETAYSVSRRYLIPAAFLNPSGENVIAVRVYDDEIAGGITNGDVGIYYSPHQMDLVMPLNGPWKLNMKDEHKFAEPDWDDSGWQEVAVPCFWDSYGYKDYDGIGWYRTEFRMPQDLADEKLILFLGRIDDVDQVYLNGKYLGKTGPWPEREGYRGLYGDYYQQVRAYFIPKNMLLPGQKNVIAIRVIDVMLHGGIWDGPVGLATRRQYMTWQDRNSSPEDFLWRLFK